MNRLLMLAALIGLAACAGRPVAPSARTLQISEIREFVIPWENAYPNDAVVDSVGRVWFTDRLTHGIGVFDPATGDFRRYPTPTPRTAPYAMVVAPDGGIWFSGSRAGLLGRIDPATARITEYLIPDAERGPDLLAWRDGEIWFTMRERRGYGRFDPATGETTLYRLEREMPYSVAMGRDAIWMSSYGTFRLLEVDPATGVATVHDLSTAPYDNGTEEDPRAAEAQLGRTQRIWPGQAHRIAVDPSGSIWATDFPRNRVLRYDPAAGTLRGWESVELRTEPYGIALSDRGLVIYAEKNANRVTVLDPVSDVRVRAAVPTPGGTIRSIAVDERRGRIWLPLSDTGRLGLIELR